MKCRATFMATPTAAFLSLLPAETNTEIYVVTYYDDYSSLAGFLGAGPLSVPARTARRRWTRPSAAKRRKSAHPHVPLSHSVTYYDARYQPIQVVRTATTAAWTA